MSKNKFKSIIDRKRVVAIPLKKKNETDPQCYRFKKVKPIGSRVTW